MRSVFIDRNFEVTKIKCKFFLWLQNRGYQKKFLTRLFRKGTFGSRNKLFAISVVNLDYSEIDSYRNDTVLVNDTEHLFQIFFTEVILPME